MSRDLSTSAYVRYALGMMSDRTILSSISRIDFENRTVSLRPGYWKVFVLFIKERINDKGLGYVLSSLKQLFIERFSLCSGKSIKNFFLNKIRRSFFDFKNILVYISKHQNDPFKRKNVFAKLRRMRYFEKKAMRYFKYVTGQPTIETSTSVDEVESSDDEFHQVIENISQDPIDDIDSQSDYHSDGSQESQVLEYEVHDTFTVNPVSVSNNIVTRDSSLVIPESSIDGHHTVIEQIGGSTMVTHRYNDGPESTLMFHNGRWV